MKSITVLVIFAALMFSAKCQTTKSKEHMITREAIAAGRFYTADSAQLRNEVTRYLANAKSKISENPAAIIVPHAGYPFSGPIAAESFHAVSPDAQFENIFLIGTSHRGRYGKASIYTEGNYGSPLGEVEVNLSLARKLVKEHNIFDYIPEAHSLEHSLEVQLPFIQCHFRNAIPIVPILLGFSKREECTELAKILTPYFNENNLFIISTDFSHYPPYKDAVIVDNNSAEAILTNNPDAVEKAIDENSSKKIRNLATSMCGWTSVMTLLEITKNEPINITALKYRNSGDTPYSGKDEVVGYWSMLFERKPREQGQQNHEKESFSLSDDEKRKVIDIARSTLESYLREGRIRDIPEQNLTTHLKKECGAFVTLHKNDELRGCIGTFRPEKPLYLVIREMALAAALNDARFPKVDDDELDEITIEVSVLTPMREITSIDQLELGKHGIYIKKGGQTGTLLPQVATKTQWSKEEFLGHCARDKARIGWDGWRDAQLYVYEAIIISENDVKNL